MRKYLFIFLGSLSLFLGFLGLVTPGLPTTPFVLLTGYLYAKSSPRLYAKLQKNRITGACLRSVDEGLSWKMRLFSISFMWLMIILTAFLVFSSEDKMRYVMIGLGVIGTIAQLITLRKKTLKTQSKSVEELISTEKSVRISNISENKKEEKF